MNGLRGVALFGSMLGIWLHGYCAGRFNRWMFWYEKKRKDRSSPYPPRSAT